VAIFIQKDIGPAAKEALWPIGHVFFIVKEEAPAIKPLFLCSKAPALL